MQKKWCIISYLLLFTFIGFGQNDFYSKFNLPIIIESPEFIDFEKKLENLMMTEGKIRVKEIQDEYLITQKYFSRGCLSPQQAEIYGDNLKEWALKLEEFERFLDSLKTNFVLKLKTVTPYKEYFLKGNSNDFYKEFLLEKYRISVVDFPKAQKCFKESAYALLRKK